MDDFHRLSQYMCIYNIVLEWRDSMDDLHTTYAYMIQYCDIVPLPTSTEPARRVGSKPVCNGKIMLRPPPAVD